MPAMAEFPLIFLLVFGPGDPGGDYCPCDPWCVSSGTNARRPSPDPVLLPADQDPEDDVQQGRSQAQDCEDGHEDAGSVGGGVKKTEIAAATRATTSSASSASPTAAATTTPTTTTAI